MTNTILHLFLVVKVHQAPKHNYQLIIHCHDVSLDYLKKKQQQANNEIALENKIIYGVYMVIHIKVDKT